MMCFHDKSWCTLSDQCARKTCPRNFNEEMKKAAEAWWGKPGAPVQFSPMQGTPGCQDQGGFLGVE